jgi:hypothetical protein
MGASKGRHGCCPRKALRESPGRLGKRIEGRKGYDDINPAVVKEAKRLARRSPKTGKARSLRQVAGELAALGFTTRSGRPFSASQVKRLVGN